MFQYDTDDLLTNQTVATEADSLVCISRSGRGSWAQQDCQTIRSVREDSSVRVFCKCTKLSPQTVVKDALRIFTDNKLAKDTFSGSGLQALSSMEIHKFLIFYLLGGFTILYLLAIARIYSTAQRPRPESAEHSLQYLPQQVSPKELLPNSINSRCQLSQFSKASKQELCKVAPDTDRNCRPEEMERLPYPRNEKTVDESTTRSRAEDMEQSIFPRRAQPQNTSVNPEQGKALAGKRFGTISSMN